MNVADINDYIIGTFMYHYMDGNISNTFQNCFQIYRIIHDYDIRKQLTSRYPKADQISGG